MTAFPKAKNGGVLPPGIYSAPLPQGFTITNMFNFDLRKADEYKYFRLRNGGNARYLDFSIKFVF